MFSVSFSVYIWYICTYVYICLLLCVHVCVGLFFNLFQELKGFAMDIEKLQEDSKSYFKTIVDLQTKHGVLDKRLEEHSQK